MDSSSSAKTAKGGYGYYNYGGSYGYGYGYGEANTGTPQRTLQDYLLILRERIWYIVVVFIVVFSSSLVYTLSLPKIYESSASVQIFRRDPNIMRVEAVVDNEIRGAEDLNTQVKVLESATIIQSVAARLTGENLRQFLAPYGGSTADANVANILARNRKIIPQRTTLIILLVYDHPDRMVAATVANLFVDAYIAHNLSLRIDQSMEAVRNLDISIEAQKKKVDQMALDLQSMREKNNMISADSRRDIVNDSLKALNSSALGTGAKLKMSEIRFQQIKERKANGSNLTDLPFISSQSLISGLMGQLSSQRITLDQLKLKYRDKHPKMEAAVKALTATQVELTKAIDDACAQIESDYQTDLRNDHEVQEKLAQQTKESLELDRFKVEYDKKERELRINETILQGIVGRSRETSMTRDIETQNAHVIDHAMPAPESAPISPNLSVNLTFGAVAGATLGFAFAFFVAYIDDRVKSSFDIESVVGLPLIGIIPQIKRMDPSEKGQIVVNNADRQVSEAFLTLHSSLRLKDESKNAKCILITSTIPGEGKSFTTTNLALTFAAHGEKVIVIDCDLRKPIVHKTFRVENLKGVIDICAGESKFDDVVLKNMQPNLDVLPAGGRAKNPTQILNSKNFELLISDLRKRYDRVFIDTPPLAVVSDALIILPIVDGSIFTVYFNKVRRKAAQFAAKKLLDANVANFGAVLNGLNLAVSGYYYAQYYDKTYKDYYLVMGDAESKKGRKGKPKAEVDTEES